MKMESHQLKRFESKKPTGGRNWRDDLPAFREARTIYGATVVDASDSPRLLVSGHNSSKIGKRIIKGKWAGLEIYTLTLEERATCPPACAHWKDCYGNNMHMARRHRDDGSLLERLRQEMGILELKHPKGYALRLHVLGDFKDAAYAKFWAEAFVDYPGLHVFGFTAHPRTSDVGEIINSLNSTEPRCSIRFSGVTGHMGSVVIDDIKDSNHIVCPAQLGLTVSCGTCALCWSTDRVIEFLKH